VKVLLRVVERLLQVAAHNAKACHPYPMQAHFSSTPAGDNTRSALTASWIGGVALAAWVGLALSTGTAIASADSGSPSASHGPSNGSASSAASTKPTSGGPRAKSARSAQHDSAQPDRSTAAGPVRRATANPASVTDRAIPASATRSAVVDVAADVPRAAAIDTSASARPVAAARVATVPAWGREIQAALTSIWHDIEAAVTFVYRRITTFVADIVDGSFPWDFPHGTSPTATPGDVVHTVYGDIGKWMLRPTSDGLQISDWIGQKYWGRNLLEPINVVIVDRTSTTAEESAQKLIDSLTAAGFPARVKHSTGYEGSIDGIDYTQQPTGAEQAFSDGFYIFPNDHGRFFGPAPATDGEGFVWVAALSRERVGVYNWQFTHSYVSFNRARDDLRAGLLGIGAVDLGTVNLDNRVNNATQTTGDSDGYAVVIELT
jgi:hypothetical protein